MTFEDGRPKLTHLDVKDGGLLLFAPVEVGLVRDRTRETRRPKPPANADDRKQRAKVLEVIAVDGTSGTGSSWRRRVCCVGHVGHRRRGSYERAPAGGMCDLPTTGNVRGAGTRDDSDYDMCFYGTTGVFVWRLQRTARARARRRWTALPRLGGWIRSFPEFQGFKKVSRKGRAGSGEG